MISLYEFFLLPEYSKSLMQIFPPPPPHTHNPHIFKNSIIKTKHHHQSSSPCKIINFIRDSGNDWENFCTNTTHPSTTKKAVKPPSPHSMISEHKTTKINDQLAPKPLPPQIPITLSFLPSIQHNDIWQMHKNAEASFWMAEEIDLFTNVTDWAGLSLTEQHFICHILSFFAASNGIINKNLCNNFTTEVTLAEA
jgi:hypothetical protein